MGLISFFFFFFYLWWILSYIEMKQPWVSRWSPSRSPLPPPSPPAPSRFSQCTRSERLSHASNLVLEAVPSQDCYCVLAYFPIFFLESRCSNPLVSGLLSAFSQLVLSISLSPLPCNPYLILLLNVLWILFH